MHFKCLATFQEMSKREMQLPQENLDRKGFSSADNLYDDLHLGVCQAGLK
jgi:hypothetical protein